MNEETEEFPAVVVTSTRTRLLRVGAAVAALVLAGSWVIGAIARGGDDPADRATDAGPADVSTPVDESIPEERMLPDLGLTEAPTTLPPVDAAALIAERTSDLFSDEPSVEKETRSPEPAPPRRTPQPSKTPTEEAEPQPAPPPPAPTNQCTDLVSAINCVLAPLTKAP